MSPLLLGTVDSDEQRRADFERQHPRCVGCGRFLGERNAQDSLHCCECWSDADDFIF